MSKKTVQINPMYALAVNVADLRQRFVLFCGAGISKDAGIPTGEDILFDMKKKIYQQEKRSTPTSDEEVTLWLKNNDEFAKLDYSQCLEQLFPGLEQRRIYLNAFFDNKTPGRVHQMIARLIKLGVFRFVITTNFDNLIEKALDEEGLKDKYSVISTDDQANHSDSWDKVSTCRIYKIHGDKDQGFIRNTLKELDELGPFLKTDFQEIINRHGVIVLGYSGLDAGVLSCFENREHLKYPLFWQYRNKVNDRVTRIIYNQDGRLIQYNSANEFLSELLDRIQIIHRQSEDNLDIITSRVRGVLVQSNPKETIVRIEDERNRFLETVSTVYANLQPGTGWNEIWNAYVDILFQFRGSLEFCEWILKLDMFEAWDEFIKIFESLQSINTEDDRNGRNGLINQLFYSILLLVGSRCLRYEKFKYLKKLLSIKRFVRERYISILDWNIIGNFIQQKNDSTQPKYYVPRLHFLLNLIENKKIFPQGEKYDDMKNYLLDFDILCFIYSVRYPNSGSFHWWYPCSAYYSEYRSPIFLIKIKKDEAYRTNISSELFNLNSEEMMDFLKTKVSPAYADLLSRMEGFPTGSVFRILSEN